MNNIKAIILCALLTMVGRAAAQTPTVKLTAGDVNIGVDKTGSLIVSMENSMEMAGWQMYLYLPEGIDIPYEEEEGEKYYDETIVLSSRHKKAHQCSVTPTADGGYLIIVYNPSKPTAINGNSGEIVTITLQASGTYSGDQTAIIKGVAASDMSSVQTDMEGEVTVNVKTGSNGIKTVMGTPDQHPSFDLGGRRVPDSAKGVIIKNGRKTVVK